VAIALLIGSVASCCAVEYRHGTDLSFERLRAVPTRFGRLVVYRTNGGVMTSYGIHRQSIWRPSRDRENCAASTVSRNRDSVRTRHCLVRQISEAGQRHGPDDQRRIAPEVRPFRLN
jgi:hypothetical protein